MRAEKNSTKWIEITLLIASSLTIMSSATIAPSLPQMSQVFKNAPHAAFLSKMILTLPALFIAAGAPVAGIVIDKFGRRILIITGLVVYAAAGSAGLYLDSLIALLVSRAFLGIAVAAIMTTSTTLIADYFEGEKRNKFMGLQGAVMAMGGVIYILLGGFLADISWRGPFSIYLFSLVILPFAVTVLYEPDRRAMGLQKSNKSYKRLVPYPFILAILVTGLVGMVIFYMVPVQIPFLLKQLGEVSNSEIGIAIACSTLMGAIVAVFYQKIKLFLSFTAIYIITFSFMAAGYILIGNASSYYEVVFGLIVNGTGMGLMMPNGTTWLMAITPVDVRGTMIGIMTTSVFLGQFCSPLLIQPLISVVNIKPAFVLTGFIMIGIAFVFLISLLIFRRLKPENPF